MTVRVGQLKLQLPSGFESRAEGIARNVAQGIAQLHPDRSLKLDVLTLEPVQIDAGATDLEVAHAVLRQLSALLGAER
jgi:hypothetical protein